MFFYREQKEKFTKVRYKIPGDAAKPRKRFGLGNYGMIDFDWVGYADDLVLAFDDIENLSKGLELLNTTLEDFGMQLNTGKTKNGIEQQGRELSLYHSEVGECQYRECQSVSIPWKLCPLQTSEHWG